MAFERKVVFLGEANVGKSTMAYRMASGSLDKRLTPTIAASYMTMVKNGIKLNMWDSSGSERFSQILPMYVRGANAIILVYDVLDARTVEKVKSLRARFLREIPETEKAYWAVVGNKMDQLISVRHANNAAAIVAAAAFASEEGLHHYTVSSYTGSGLDHFISETVEALKQQVIEIDPDIIKIICPETNSKSKDGQNSETPENSGGIQKKFQSCCQIQ